MRSINYKKGILLIVVTALLSLFGSNLMIAKSYASNPLLTLNLSLNNSKFQEGSTVRLTYTIKNNSTNTIKIYCNYWMYETDYVELYRNSKKMKSFITQFVKPAVLHEKDLTDLSPGKQCSFQLNGKIKRTQILDSKGKVLSGIFLTFERSAILLEKNATYVLIGNWSMLNSPLFLHTHKEVKQIWYGQLHSNKVHFQFCTDMESDLFSEKLSQTIIEIAKNKAISLKYDMKKTDIFFDKDGTLWNDYVPIIKNVEPNFLKQLKGKNFYSVFFRPKKDEGKDLWIIIDKNTKKVIAFFQGR